MFMLSIFIEIELSIHQKTSEDSKGIFIFSLAPTIGELWKLNMTFHS
jgi:hypothetical protein